jgi:type VI secretion system protein ImpK
VQRLIDHAHIPAARLEATGRADTDPVVSNTTESGRRRNRRIEIILLPPAAAQTRTAS